MFFTALIVFTSLSGFVPQPAAAQGGLPQTSQKLGVDLENAVRQVEDVRRLRPGIPVLRPITGSEKHLYRITLAAGQLLTISLQQKGVDVALSISDPDGTVAAKADSPNGAFGLEEISIVSDQSGEHQLEIKPYEGDQSRGSYRLAIKTFRPATNTDRSRFKAYGVFAEGLLLSEKGEKAADEASLLKFKQAFEIYRAAGDPRGQALCLYHLALINRYLGSIRVSIDYFERSLVHWRGLGDVAAEFVLFATNGLNYEAIGKYDEAMRGYNRALVLAGMIGDEKGIGDTHNNIGTLYQRQNKYDLALTNLNKAVATLRKFGDPREPEVLSNIGLVRADKGEYAKALDILTKVIEPLRKLESKNFEGFAQIGIGDINFVLGNLDKALEQYTLSLELFRAIGHRRGEAQALSNIGQVYLLQGNVTKNKEFLNLALQVASSGDDPLMEAYVIKNLGLTSLKEADFDNALLRFEKTLPLMRAQQNRHGEAQVLNHIGQTLLASGKQQGALEAFRSALAVNREVKEKVPQADTLTNLMLASEALGSRRLAISFGKEAVNIYQIVRSEIQPLGDEKDRSFTSSRESTYRKLAELLIREGRLPEAEKVLEMLKQEEYFKLVRRGGDVGLSLDKRVNLRPAERDAVARYEKIADKITALGAEFGRLEKERNAPNISDAAAKSILARQDAVSEKLKDARLVFDKFIEGLKLQLDQKDARISGVAEGLQADVKGWGDPHVVVISTIVGKENLSIIVTTTEIQTSHVVPISDEKVNTLVGEFRQALTDPASDPTLSAQKLYDVLVKPLEKDLAGVEARTLIWSLDGSLRYIPVAALWDKDKGYLIQQYSNAVITVASRGNLALRAVDKKGWRALGVGVSKSVGGFEALAHVPEELNSIIRDTSLAQTNKSRSVLSGRLLLNEKFTYDAFRLNLGRFPIIHAATHFSFISGVKNESMESFLLLGNGEKLTLSRIQSSGTIFNGVQLLALSACDTAYGGKDADGGEIEGFGKLAQDKGAKSVIATLWRVADESTRDLMVGFYQNYQQNPQTKAEALRRAQLEMLGEIDRSSTIKNARQSVNSNLKFKHPYYWSSYILIGNWW